MNLRVVTFLSSEEEDVVKELVADFSEALLARGFANDVDNTESSLKSLIVVKENIEILGESPEEFFQEQLENSLMTVIPTDINAQIDGLPEAVKEYTGDDEEIND